MKTVDIAGMHCLHCVAAVKKALDVLGFQRVVVDLDKNNAVIWDDSVNEEAVRRVIEDQGFEVKKIY